MNAGFEDISILYRNGKMRGLETVFSEYEKITKMQMPLPSSYRNFLKSSKTADDKFLLQKKNRKGLF
jgi:hypothetical protein